MMISLTTFLVTFLWSVFTATQCYTNPGQATTSYEDLRKGIAASFQCRDNPGMVVAVVKDGKTVFSEAFGETLPGSKVNVTTETKFLISSLTKAFTAALMVDVFANNSRNVSYNLGAPLRDIMGEDFSFADEERTKYGTAEDILSHRIGLPNKAFMRFNPSFNRSDFINFARYLKTSYPFRGRARYSSVTYTIAAAITEHLSGKKWEELARERIFEPLGMTSTGFAFTTDFSDTDVAKPYSIFKGRNGVIDPLFTRVWNSRCGSGCIISTVDDMVKWMNFILSGGKNAKGEQVWPVAEVQTLTKIRTYLLSTHRDLISKPVFPHTSVADEYALGWRHGIYRGYKILSHTGSSPGYASMIMMYPSENMGIFMAMNGDDDQSYYRLALIHYISDVILGQPTWLNTSTLCTFPEPWAAPTVRPTDLYDTGLKPALPYIEYIGAYKSPVYGEAFVNFNQSTFSLQGFYGLGSWQLFPQKETNRFYGKGIWAVDFWDVSGWQFMTAKDSPKNVTRLSIYGLDIRDPPVFEKEFN